MAVRKIVLVEDDFNFAFMLKDGLECAEFEVIHVSEEAETVKIVRAEKPDIVILDVKLKGNTNGFEIGRQIRAFCKDVFLIFATSQTQFKDIEEGHRIGDLFIKKPYSIREMLLQIHNLIDKKKSKEKNFLIGTAVFIPEEHLVKEDNKEIHLKKSECILLEQLCVNRNRVVTKEELVATIWIETDVKTRENSLNNLVSSLRKKLHVYPNIDIQTVSKEGYKFLIKNLPDATNDLRRLSRE
jgi:DNA-binding response OmpR family regulator